MEITVRFARYSELKEVNRIRRQVNELHVEGRPDIFRPGFCEEMENHILNRFNEENFRVIVALCDDIICGFATIEYTKKPLSPYNLERKIYQVEEFGVDKSYRRMGVATAIVEFMKQDASEKGFPRIELDMWEFNEGALEFYNAAGFVTYRRYMELNVKGYPTRENAERILENGINLNPGNWGNHSIVVAKCAEKIAKATGELDSEKAYVLGLMHDIGRQYGYSEFRHVYDGYMYMSQLGYTEAAKICLTHSFSVKKYGCLYWRI